MFPSGSQVEVLEALSSSKDAARSFAACRPMNDLTQLTLGVDRDSAALASMFDERDPAVKWMIETVIDRAHKAGRHVGLCGQAPSDHPDYAAFLVGCGIDSISVTPDSFVAVKRAIATAESIH